MKYALDIGRKVIKLNAMIIFRCGKASVKGRRLHGRTETGSEIVFVPMCSVT
jgi:hypothetical protein